MKRKSGSVLSITDESLCARCKENIQGDLNSENETPIDPHLPEQLYHQGRFLEDICGIKGEEAKDYFRRAAYFHSKILRFDFHVSLWKLIDICNRLGDEGLAISYATKVIDYHSIGLQTVVANASPEQRAKAIIVSDLYVTRGRLYLKEGDAKRAIKDFSKAIEINPNNQNGYCGRGNVYSRTKEYDKALIEYSQAATAPAYINRGRIYLKIGNHNQAVADYSTAIEMDPNPWTYCARARLNIALHRYDEAITDSTKAIVIYHELGKETYIHGYRIRYIAYRRNGETDKAAADREKCLTMRLNKQKEMHETYEKMKDMRDK